MTRRSWTILAGLVGAAALIGTAIAWHAPGHDRIVRQAVPALPDDLPAFFRAGADTIANDSLEPDNFRAPIAASPLAEAEAPEHYFDIENVPDLDHLPKTRYQFLATVYAHKLKPAEVGLLPYAITEWTGRLTVAFAEHRRWPDNKPIRQECLFLAGMLAHYAGDLCQPLHTTIHFDGRVVPGQLPARGIHLKTDAALGKLAFFDLAVHPAPFDDVMAATLAELNRSHALVDRVYELDAAGDLPDYRAPLDQTSKCAQFLRERLGAAAQFTASLFLTAWRDSAKVKLPDWQRRPPVTPDKMPATQSLER